MTQLKICLRGFQRLSSRSIFNQTATRTLSKADEYHPQFLSSDARSSAGRCENRPRRGESLTARLREETRSAVHRAGSFTGQTIYSRA
jgi:hypothetical protein